MLPALVRAEVKRAGFTQHVFRGRGDQNQGSTASQGRKPVAVSPANRITGLKKIKSETGNWVYAADLVHVLGVAGSGLYLVFLPDKAREPPEKWDLCSSPIELPSLVKPDGVGFGQAQPPRWILEQAHGGSAYTDFVYADSGFHCIHSTLGPSLGLGGSISPPR